ncbi:putative cysteine-rich protein YhjQ [Burkholderiales bacterium]|nr:putative cysteine-rich protein YhjQ [Burkholderiales bacterium]
MAQQQFSSCIEACDQCAQACSHCAVACLQEDDPKAMARCIALDIDCAEACRFASAVMSRGSELAQSVCALCADICEACGEECARHPMAHCQECAQACKRCAQECRRMASMAVGSTRTQTGAHAH